MAESNQLEQKLREYYNKGLFALEKKNYDYAIELFSQALTLKNDFADARHYLRLVEQRRVLEHPPSLPELLFNKLKNTLLLLKAMILDFRHLYAQAACEYEKILRSEPNNVLMLTLLAQELLKEKDALSAMKIFEQIRQIDPSNIMALKSLGRLCAQLENFALARECYEAVLKVCPHDPEAEKGVKNLDALGVIKQGFGQGK